MGTIDLNAARAARAEAGGLEEKTLVVGDDTYPLPSELPVALLEAVIRAQAGDIAAFQDAMVALFGAETYSELVAKHRLSVEDLVFAIEAVVDDYGVTLGESPASAASSGTTTPPSRPTSGGTTAQTSEKPSSAPATP